MDEWSREHTASLVRACLESGLLSEAEAATLLELIDRGLTDAALDILEAELDATTP